MTGKVIVMDHPLITHKINYVRQENVGTKEFREVIGEIAQLMCYEATRDLKMSDVQIKTPIMEMTGKMLSGKNWRSFRFFVQVSEWWMECCL